MVGGMSESNKSVQVSPSDPVKIMGPSSAGIYSTSPPIYASPNSFPTNFTLGGMDEHSIDDLSDTIAYSFPKSKIKVLLLENISATAVNLFERQSFSVRVHATFSF
uniref:Uncharacterized protein n=1 Tax=Rhodosorus marinus TaxID=101924 RepID=A0A7S3ACA3_9RHOD|mmetsp:Transcript_8155/g.36380  ORF Transcript_8155/g.36380 Transcript_8155/m.36380 type:complete len:106 (+) Transcript_8155:368-685(+)